MFKKKNRRNPAGDSSTCSGLIVANSPFVQCGFGLFLLVFLHVKAVDKQGEDNY